MTPSSASSVFNGTAGTAYVLRWTTIVSSCPSSSDDVNITFNRIPTTSNAGADQTSAATCGLTSVTLAANTPTIGTGVWSVVSGTGGSFVTSSNPATIFNGTTGTAYVLRWTISNAPCTPSADDGHRRHRLTRRPPSQELLRVRRLQSPPPRHAPIHPLTRRAQPTLISQALGCASRTSCRFGNSSGCP